MRKYIEKEIKEIICDKKHPQSLIDIFAKESLFVVSDKFEFKSDNLVEKFLQSVHTDHYLSSSINRDSSSNTTISFKIDDIKLNYHILNKKLFVECIYPESLIITDEIKNAIVQKDIILHLKCMDYAIEQQPLKNNNKLKTIVINSFAGPGAGKTTCSWEIASQLKKKGLCVEYVSEYAKDLVWNHETDKLNGSLFNQRHLLKEQNNRVNRLLGQVDIIVTDSPVVMNYSYLKGEYAPYKKEVLNLFNKNNNFNYFINRNKQFFESRGRIHDLNESIEMDRKIKHFLNENNIYYGNYNHDTTYIAINNIVKHFYNINNKKKDKMEELER